MSCTVVFNQDHSSLSICHLNAIQFLEFDGAELINAGYKTLDGNPIIVERLFSSNLIALVLKESSDTLKIIHFEKLQCIMEKRFQSEILCVKLNRTILIVCTDKTIYVHNLTNMKELATINELNAIMTRTVALSSSSVECILAYAGLHGNLHIYNVTDLKEYALIKAHNSRIRKIAFDSSGNTVATASRKGTVIRVFSVASGQKLFELRRGLRRSAIINDLAFSSHGCYLSVSSSTNTIHIFQLQQYQRRSETSNELLQDGWLRIISKTLIGVGSHVLVTSSALSDIRAFATIHLPCQYRSPSVCGINSSRSLQVIIASEDGMVRIYEIDKCLGGEAQLLSETNVVTDIITNKPTTAANNKNDNAL
ncbi:hypothetical protein GJ496_004592 [Pomphorhynchus laevis]|nr:hypothetical protein GJ496_004592 [Pomphorhynchus laevis]